MAGATASSSAWLPAPPQDQDIRPAAAALLPRTFQAPVDAESDPFEKFVGMTGGQIIMEVLRDRGVSQVFG